MKYRHLGCSNFFGWQVANANGVAERMNLEPMVAGQLIYNLNHRKLEREVIPASVDSGLVVICYSPLGGGLLTGNYQRMSEPEEYMRMSHQQQVDKPRFWMEKGFKIANAPEIISQKSVIPMRKLAIVLPLRRRFVTSAITGVSNISQLEANLELEEWDLHDDIWESFEELTRPEEEYLSWFNKVNCERFFSIKEFHDETTELRLSHKRNVPFDSIGLNANR